MWKETAWNEGAGVCKEVEAEIHIVSTTESPVGIFHQLQNHFQKKYKFSNFLTCITTTTCNF